MLHAEPHFGAVSEPQSAQQHLDLTGNIAALCAPGLRNHSFGDGSDRGDHDVADLHLTRHF